MWVLRWILYPEHSRCQAVESSTSLFSLRICVVLIRNAGVSATGNCARGGGCEGRAVRESSSTPNGIPGKYIERLGTRAFVMQNLVQEGGTVRLTFEGPTRGLFGTATNSLWTRRVRNPSSRVLASSIPGEIKKRQVGSMIYGNWKGAWLRTLEPSERGVLYITPATGCKRYGYQTPRVEMVANPTG